jgi:hypothetical protein
MAGRSYVDMKLVTNYWHRSFPRVDRLVRKVHEPILRRILEGHGEPVGLDALISTSVLDCDDIELEELNGLEDPS